MTIIPNESHIQNENEQSVCRGWCYFAVSFVIGLACFAVGV